MNANAQLDEDSRRAIGALDHLLREHPQNIERDIIEATRAVVRLRDRLIASRRESGGKDATPRLEHANAVISVLMAGHYAIEGVRWDAIKKARDALAALTPETSTRHAQQSHAT